MCFEGMGEFGIDAALVPIPAIKQVDGTRKHELWERCQEQPWDLGRWFWLGQAGYFMRALTGSWAHMAGPGPDRNPQR